MRRFSSNHSLVEAARFGSVILVNEENEGTMCMGSRGCSRTPSGDRICSYVGVGLAN